MYKIVSIHPCTHAVLYIAIQLLYIAMLQLLHVYIAMLLYIASIHLNFDPD